MKACRNCLLPPEAPGADIDAKTGICAKCREYPRGDLDGEEQSEKARQDVFELALQNLRGKGEYDCLVNLSGGKDSCYLLYRLAHEYGLKVLAFTTDMNVP